ncbi:hypothetical protein ACKU3Z_002145 [Pseudomonas aeruginosa]
MLAANKKSEFREQLEQKLGLTSPSSLQPCRWPRANSAPSQASQRQRTAAHCWRNSLTPACTATSKAADQRASQADEQRKQLEQRLEGSLPCRAGPGRA